MFKIRNFVIKLSFSKHKFHFINLHNFSVLQMNIFKIFLIIWVSRKFESPRNALNPSDSVTSKLIFIEFEFLLLHLQIPTIIAQRILRNSINESTVQNLFVLRQISPGLHQFRAKSYRLPGPEQAIMHNIFSITSTSTHTPIAPGQFNEIRTLQ